MLKLVSQTKNKIEPRSAHETDANPSHEFINEIIAHIQYAHLDEVWESRLNQLMQPLESDSILIRKKFKVL